jgi:hypothetical protein
MTAKQMTLRTDSAISRTPTPLSGSSDKIQTVTGITDSIVKYGTALKTDQFLLIVHGTAEQVAKAKDAIVETTNPSECLMHYPKAASATV